MDKAKLLKTLETLRLQFKSGVNFLKKTRIDKNDSETKLHHAHWFLVLGSKHAGKTQLLANAELPYTLSRKSLHKEKEFESNWWVTKNAVLLDVPASYLLTKHLKIWKYFVKLVRRFSFQKKLDGIIIVLTLQELQSNQNHKVLIKTIAKRLQVVRNRFKQRIPIYFFFNKMDKLTGFNDFFNDLSKSERQQAWGMYLTPKKNLIKQVKSEFKYLQERLQTQLIWQLKNNKTPEKANSMREFCDHFVELSPVIDSFFAQVKKQLQKCYFVSGCFFTSAHNQSKEKALALQSNIQFNQKVNAYFSHDILQHITARESSARKKHNINLISYTAITCLVVVIAAAFTLAYEVGQRERNLQFASQAIANFQAQAKKSNSEKLKALSKANNALNQSLTPSAGNNIDKKLRSIYDSTLNQTVLPNIENILVSTLKNTSSDTIKYQALEAYTMLEAPGKIDVKRFTQILQFIISAQKTKNNDLDTSNIKSILQSIAQRQTKIQLNDTIINNTRNYFLQLPAPQLAFIILASQPGMNQQFELSFQDNNLTKNIFQYHSKPITIPKLYTKETYKALTPTALYQYASEVIYGNNTLGHFARTQIKPEDVVQAMQTIYNKNYNNYWQTFINGIELIPTSSLKQDQLELTAISTKNAGLDALLNLINKNLPDAMPLSPELTQLKSFQTSKRMSYIKQQFSILTQAIDTINSAQESQQQAYIYAKNRFINRKKNDVIEKLFMLSQQAPAPLNTWFTHLVENTWQSVMSQTQQYLSQQYQKNLLSFYNNQFKGNFPFDQQSNSQVPLDAFTHFFGTSGLVSQFIQQELEPFIDTDTFPYQQRSRDGLSLNISQDALNALQQAKKIEYAFFENNSMNPFMRFSLQPTSADGKITAINITLGSQKTLLNQSNMLSPQYLNWPDNLDKSNASITFTDSNNQSFQLKESGPWALFKIFSQAQFTATKNHTSWLANFAPSNKQVPDMQLQIQVKVPYNPFDLSVFTNFNLPENFITQ